MPLTCMKSIIPVPSRRAPLFVGLALLVSPLLMNAQATPDTASRQTQNPSGQETERGFNYGWLGLLGLAGLAGLRRRQPVLHNRLATETR